MCCIVIFPTWFTIKTQSNNISEKILDIYYVPNICYSLLTRVIHSKQIRYSQVYLYFIIGMLTTRKCLARKLSSREYTRGSSNVKTRGSSNNVRVYFRRLKSVSVDFKRQRSLWPRTVIGLLLSRSSARSRLLSHPRSKHWNNGVRWDLTLSRHRR